jgi:ribosomal protein S18 acetylase RimI-like enzyme
LDQVSICRVGPGNSGILARIAPDVFNDAVDPHRLDAYLAFDGSMMVLALDGDLVVGQVKAAVHLHPDKPADLYVDEVGVTPSHQRRGIARAMLDEAQRWALERGCADVWLAADPDNRSARSLYESFAESKAAILYFWDL